MLHRIMPAVLLAAFGLHVPSANAVTVELVPVTSTATRATAIRDLVIDGRVFDVEFVYDNYTNLLGSGAFYFFGDEAGATAAAKAINAVLNETTASQVGPPLKPGEGFLTPNGRPYYIPFAYTPDPGYTTTPFLFTRISTYFDPGWMDNSGSDLESSRAPGFVDHIPVFTVVPVPPALGLFAACLGVLVHLRRRT